MKIPGIVDAMNYIDDDLVCGAVEYQKISLIARLFRKPLKVCVSFLIIVIVLGIVF